MPGYIIILNMCTINDNQMMYVWCLRYKHDRIFLSFWNVFSPFTPLTTWKIKILKNLKNVWRYYHFTQVYHKWEPYDVWFLRYEAWQTKCFVFTFLPPNNPKNQNFEKLKKKNTWSHFTQVDQKSWKKAWRYHHFTDVYQKLRSDDVRFLRYGVRCMNGWKKWHRDGCPT